MAGMRWQAARTRYENGVVTLEFLMLFPVIVAMLYAAAVYGIVFFSQYRMQSAVEQAVDAALYVDRSAYQNDSGGDTSSTLQAAVLAKAQTALSSSVSALPLDGLSVEGGACSVEHLNNDVEMLRCKLTYTKVGSIVPVMRFGSLGNFPPLPDQLKAEARAAF